MSVLLKCVAAACLASILTGCCCFGGSDDDRDRYDDGDYYPLPHSEGAGNGV